MKKVDVANYVARLGGAFEKAKFPAIVDLSHNVYSVVGKLDPALGAFRQGNRLYKEGEFDAAIPYLQTAVEGGYSNVEAPRRLAISYYETESLDKAQKVVEAAMADNRYAAADKDALRTILEKIQTSSLEPVASSQGGGAKDAKKEKNKVLKPWQKVEVMQQEYKEKSSKSSWVYKFADALQSCGRIDEAAEQFAIAFENSGKSSWYAYRTGLTYELGGDRDRAHYYYSKAIEYDSKFTAAKFGIGPFHIEKGYLDLAAVAYAENFHKAKDAGVRLELALRTARSYAQLLDVEKAAEFYNQVLELKPFDSSLMHEYSDVLEIAGRVEEASVLAETVLFMHDSGKAYDHAAWVLARLLAKQGKYEEAAHFFRQVICSEPNAEFGDSLLESDEQISVDSGVESYLQHGLGVYKPSTVGDALFAFELAQKLGMPEEGERYLTLINLQNHTVDSRVLERLVEKLINERRYEEVCSLALQSETNHPPRVYRQKLPPAGSHSNRLLKYAEWCDLPLRDNLVFYESNLGLSIDCNPYAIYRRLRKEKGRDLFHVWAVDGEVSIPLDVQADPNTVVIKKSSLAYTKMLATAKYVVNNSTFPTYFIRREGQVYLMTWHGTPLKTLGKDQHGAVMTHGNMARNYLQASHMIFPNEHTRRVMIDHADIGELVTGKIEITGYPRNDVLVRTAGSTGNVQPIALFAPTWRESDSMEAQASHLVRVCDALRSAGFRPLLRAHHYVEKAARELDSQLEFVDRAVSTYDLLPEVDLLVTDFSSIYFDFAVTNRPIVFFVPDWEDYSNERGVYFDKSHLPGAVCEDYDELLATLACYPGLPLASEQFLHEFAPMEDGSATERTIDLIFGQEKDNPDVTISLKAVERSPQILFRQSLIPNGMASSFVSLSKQLVTHGIGVTVLTAGEALRSDENRQQTLKVLPAEAKVIGRVGPIVKSAIEYHNSIIDRNRTKERSLLSEETHRLMFEREANRIMPGSSFDAYIEFDGYSEFMADIMLALANNRALTGLYLHSDIVAEAKTRMPELYRMIDIANKFDKVVSVSERLMKLNSLKYLHERGVQMENPAYIENSIVGDEIVMKSHAEMEIGLPEGFVDGYYVHVGRFSPEKNQLFLLDVLGELVQKGCPAKLVFVGDGPERSRIEERVEALGLSSHVFFTGMVQNPYPYIVNSNGLLLPSLHEGQPIVILEAATLGIPVFASQIDAVKGMQHLVDMNVLPFDAKEWADSLLLPRSYERARFDYHAYEMSAVQQFTDVFLA